MTQVLETVNIAREGLSPANRAVQPAQGLPELVAAPEPSPLQSVFGPQQFSRDHERAQLLTGVNQFSSNFQPELAADALAVRVDLAADAQPKPGLLRQLWDKLKADTIEVADFVKFASETHLPAWLSNLVVASVDFTLALPNMVRTGIDYLNKKASACWDLVCEKCSDLKNWAAEFISPALEWASKMKDSVTEFFTGKSEKIEKQILPELLISQAAGSNYDRELRNSSQPVVESSDLRFQDQFKTSLKVLEIINEFAEVMREHKRADQKHDQLERREFDEKRRESLRNIAEAIALHPKEADIIRSLVQAASSEMGAFYDPWTDGELASLVKAAQAGREISSQPAVAAQIVDVTSFTNGRSKVAA